MVGFLTLVAVLAYIMATIAFLTALTATDIQFILAGVYATCGTVAAGCAGIISQLEHQRAPAQTAGDPPS